MKLDWLLRVIMQSKKMETTVPQRAVRQMGII
jgi:hypothetical protein